MNTGSNPFPSTMQNRERSFLSSTGRAHQESRRLNWWYRLASPLESERFASYKERELYRRGRSGSLIILALMLLLLLSLPADIIVGSNPSLLFLVIGLLLLLMGGALLNRMGHVNSAGVLVVLISIAFPIITIVTTPRGMSMTELPLFGLLVLPLVATISFLPALWVFVVAGINVLFVGFSLMYLPHTEELSSLLHVAFFNIMAPIVLIQFIVSVVAYTWIQSTKQALLRIERAEELLNLEHDLVIQAEKTVHQKRNLERSIQHIVHVHTRISNGDWHARVFLEQGDVLAQVSGSLNTLLTRQQRWLQDIAEIKRMKQALQQTREENSMLVRRMRERLS